MTVNLISFIHPILEEDNYPYIVTDQNGFIITFSKFLKKIFNVDPAYCQKSPFHICFYSNSFSKYIEPINNFLKQRNIQQNEEVEEEFDQKDDSMNIYKDVRVAYMSHKIGESKEMMKFYKMLQRMEN